MDYIKDLIKRYPVLQTCQKSLKDAVSLLSNCYKNGGKVLVCGNGGSAADAEHIVGELMKGFLSKRPLTAEERETIEHKYGTEGEYIVQNLQQAVPAVSLSGSNSLATAFANDVNPEFVFAQQVYGLGNSNDVLICLSTSGNSKNVVRAAQVAALKNIKILSLTGAKGGELKKYSDVLINVPSENTPEIQELHLPVYHAICAQLEADLFASGSAVKLVDLSKIADKLN